MITYFYKILYKNKDVVYVGVTTTTIQKRFNQHKMVKKLNPKLYSIIEFDRIEHGDISSIDDYYREKKKVAELERKYITEEKAKGSNLLNISVGGEWGAYILHNLYKKRFIEKYGSYDGFEKHREHILIVKNYINNWIGKYRKNKTKIYLYKIIRSKIKNKTSNYIYNWIRKYRRNKTKRYISCWIYNYGINKTKQYLHFFISHRSYNKTKSFIYNWLLGKTMNKTKYYFRLWFYGKIYSKTKKYLYNWIANKSDKYKYN